ncbi:MAG: hypothetical protein EHM70_19040 [Chloroflexota bacterium]|nr:MAG: hypothetical protein EHM70_19040 [Chloroflexota bacterium]
MDTFESILQTLDGVSQVEGITPINILELPESLCKALKKLLRIGSMSLNDLANETSLSEDQARIIGERLVQKGYLVVQDAQGGSAPIYRTYFARMRGQNLPLDL